MIEISFIWNDIHKTSFFVFFSSKIVSINSKWFNIIQTKLPIFKPIQHMRNSSSLNQKNFLYLLWLLMLYIYIYIHNKKGSNFTNHKLYITQFLLALSAMLAHQAESASRNCVIYNLWFATFEPFLLWIYLFICTGSTFVLKYIYIYIYNINNHNR